ncbi:MAG: acyl carrier protein [Clostridia bacterium]|nr:acyl carrier protein [Oscillospiraceae bacterium]MBR6748479.1 acyl carrier protein [Clostridia bacterium]
MIFDILVQLLSEQFDVEPNTITMNTDLEEELGADSLDAVELALALEEEFDLENLLEEDMLRFHTVGDIVEFIQERVD